MNCENGKSIAYERLGFLFDDGCYTELDRFAGTNDGKCEVVTAFGNVNGAPCYAYSQDITVNSGAMGRAQAAKIMKVYDLALMNGAPIVGIFDSKGAFAEEGVDALNAYGSLIAAAGKLSGVVPQISIIAGKCIGSAAVLASLADITVMAKDAEFCVNSSSLTDNKEVGSSEVAAKNGTAAIVTECDKCAVSKAAELLTFLPCNNLSVAALSDYVPAVASGEGVYASVSSVADAESFLELSEEFGSCAKVGFARIAGNPVGIVATDASKNNACLCSNGTNKIARFVRLCDAFSIPILTLLDCAGFMGNAKDELDGSVKSVSSLIGAFAEATTVKVTVITGKAYGTAYTAMAGKGAGADYVLALPTASICALNPMTAVQFLYKDRLGAEKREDLEKEYATNEGSPYKACENGAVNDVVEPEKLAEALITVLDMMASKRVSTLDKKHSNMPY